MNPSAEILQKLRAVFSDCQTLAVTLSQQHPSTHHGFVCDMQFASTYGSFLANIKMNHGIDMEKDSLAARLVNALAKTDSHTIGKIREEVFANLDGMKPEQYPSYLFLTCFPSIHEALKDS
jgi:hypothetical protein